MMIIRTEDGNNLQWNLGQPKLNLSVREMLGIKHVHVDGAELHSVSMLFRNRVLRTSEGCSVTFWGDEARYIVSNL